jgi:integrase
MPRAQRANLTDMAIKAMKHPPSGKTITVWDAASPVGLRVSQGAKTFIIMVGSGKRERIGSYPTISLSQAREEAKKRISKRTLGLVENRETSLSFQEALELFISTHCAQKNKPITRKGTEALLRNHFKFGSRALTEITRKEVTDIIDRLLTKPGAANHAFTAIRTFFRWATRRQLIAHSPCEGMQLPSRPKSKDRVLTDPELLSVWCAAERVGYPFGAIVRLLILTGQRRHEITALRSEYLDTKQKTITLPPSLTKNNENFTFPYGDMAAAIIEKCPRENGWLFAARGNPDNSFSG